MTDFPFPPEDHTEELKQLRRLRKLVIDMRKQQAKYAREKSMLALQKARTIEAHVDLLLDEMKEPDDGRLF